MKCQTLTLLSVFALATLPGAARAGEAMAQAEAARMRGDSVFDASRQQPNNAVFAFGNGEKRALAANESRSSTPMAAEAPPAPAGEAKAAEGAPPASPFKWPLFVGTAGAVLGCLLGALMGAPFGIVGIVIGAFAGLALGAFLGSLAANIPDLAKK